MAKQVKMAVVLVIIAFAAGYWWWLHQGRETTDNAYVKADIIPLMTAIDGTVVHISAPANQRVEQGAELVHLDDGVAEAQLAQARAQRQKAEAVLVHLSDREAEQSSLIQVSKASLEAAQAELKRAQQQLDRVTKLKSSQYASTDNLEAAELTLSAANANLHEAQAKLAAAKAALATIHSEEPELQADVAAAKAQQHSAELHLSYTKVIAPRAGIVTSRQVQLGQSVHTGQRLLSIVTDPVWIYANYKETQIGDIHIGDAVEIELDAFPGKRFSGHVDSFYAATGSEFALLPAQNATGNFTKVVQRLPVKIVFDDDQVLAGIRPGMSAVTTIITSAKDS
ncbi:MAG: HlyD family secretion protein [Oleibacter sp.]|nr:HlyD family secretion protein [Thalassolituus sp.]